MWSWVCHWAIGCLHIWTNISLKRNFIPFIYLEKGRKTHVYAHEKKTCVCTLYSMEDRTQFRERLVCVHSTVWRTKDNLERLVCTLYSVEDRRQFREKDSCVCTLQCGGQKTICKGGFLLPYGPWGVTLVSRLSWSASPSWATSLALDRPFCKGIFGLR